MLPDWALVFIAVVGALIGREGLGALKRALAQAKSIEAQARHVDAKASLTRAEASVREISARRTLDESTRAWADKLVARYDSDIEELRCVLRQAEKRHAAERESLEAEIQVLRSQVNALQKENTMLRFWLERLGVPVGTGPIDPTMLETPPPPVRREMARDCPPPSDGVQRLVGEGE